MKYKLFALAALIAILGTLVLPVLAHPVSAQGGSFTGIPVSGTTDSGAIFEGTLDITRFVFRQGQILAQGSLTGTLTDAAGTVIGTVTDFPVTLPVTNLDADCQVLHLELGPLDLDLLGLEVHLDRIVLDIDADPTGGLLGQLLCALANALDGGGSLRAVTNLLNQILRVLG